MVSDRQWCRRLRAKSFRSQRSMVVPVITVVILASLGCGTPPDVTASSGGSASSPSTSVTPTADSAVASSGSTVTTVASSGDLVSDSQTSAGSVSSASSSTVETSNVEASNVATSAAETSAPKPSAESQQTDYVWIEFVALQSGRSWTEITADGEATNIRFGLPGTSDLAEVKTGTLDAAAIGQVFSLLDELDFLDVESANAADEGQIYEGDILVVAAELGGRQNSATFRPPEHMPASIEAMVDEVDGLLSGLEVEPAPAFFVRSELISPSRLDWLMEKNTTFIDIATGPFVDSYPSLGKSKTTPGRMIALPTDERAAIASDISNDSSLFLSTPDGPYKFEVFSLES